MHTGLEDRPWHLPQLAAYAAERARGGVGLIVTGGYAPTRRGWLKPFAAEMTTRLQAMRHREVTDAVHAEGGAIALQVLHAGRYGYHPFSVSASTKKSPITPFRPSALSTKGVDGTASAFARSVALARKAGYDARRDHGLGGVPDQPVPRRPHQRPHRRLGRHRGTADALPARDRAPGARGGRPRASRSSTGSRCWTWSSTARRGTRSSTLAHRLEDVGVTVLNTGIGWHEARVPTIITQVPQRRLALVDRAAEGRGLGARCAPPTGSTRRRWPRRSWRPARPTWSRWPGRCWPTPTSSRRLPRAAPTRSTPASRATRPAWTTCSANRTASCLVNPRAGRETTLVLLPLPAAARPPRVAVVGAGPAGLAAAVSAAERGFAVTLFEKADAIGGQFRLAMAVPGKEDFAETLRYYAPPPRGARRRRAPRRPRPRSPTWRCTTRSWSRPACSRGCPTSTASTTRRWRRTPRSSAGGWSPGRRVAVIGAGGIGVDVGALPGPRPRGGPRRVDGALGRGRPGAAPRRPDRGASRAHRRARSRCCSARHTPIGMGLGKTSGWAHRAVLRQSGVALVSRAWSTSGSTTRASTSPSTATPRVLEVDTVVVCAGPTRCLRTSSAC